MIYLFDKSKTLIATIPGEFIRAHSQEQVLNDLITATATVKYSAEAEAAHFFGAKDVDDESIFWRYKIDRFSKEDGQATLEGTYELFDDLAGRGVIVDKRPSKSPALPVLTYILEGTGWTVGTINTTHTASTSHYFVQKLTAFWDFLDKWRVEFRPRITMTGSTITGKYIDIMDHRSQDYGKWYEYGGSLATVTAERNAVPYTAYIGRGKGEETGDGYGRRITFEELTWTTPADPVDKPAGQLWVEIPEATALYGYEDGTPRIGTVEFPDIEDPAELLKATYDHAEANARPQVQLSSTVIETGAAELGETATIIRDDLGIRYKTRIFKIKRDFVTKEIRSIELGDKIQVTSAQRTATINAQAKAKEVETLGLLQTLRAAIADAYFGADGYNYDLPAGNEYGIPGGFYSFNAPIDQNPTKVVYMGAGTLLIANSKNPAGQWEWRTAVNGDGVVADTVSTGQLQGGKVTWNLDTGVLFIGDSFENAQLSWDGETLKIDGASIDLTANDYFKSTVTDAVAEEVGKISLYQTDIISTGGLVFKNGIISTTLIGRVYKSGKDVTDEVDISRFRWSKTNADGTPDVPWNERYFGGAKQITVTEADIYRRSTFTLKILEG